MTWGAYGARNPSHDGIRRHEVSEAVNRPISKTAGQGQERPAHTKRPQRGSTQTITGTNCGFPGGSAGDRRQFPGRCRSKRAHIASGL